MAHKKASGRRATSRSNPRCSASRCSPGQDVQLRDDPRPPARHALPPGPGTGIGKDDTIFAKRDGVVAFRTSGERRFISVVDAER